MKSLLKYVKPYNLRMLLGLLIKVVGTVMDLAIPYILSYMIDDLVPLGDVNKVAIFGGLMVMCSMICFIGNVKANQMASFVAKGATEDLRHDLFAKVEKLSSKQIDEITMPSLVSRLNNDTYNIHHCIAMVQRIGVRAPILLIGGIIVTLTMNVKLTLVLLVIMPIIFALSIYISKIGVPLYTKIQKAVDDMVRKIRENITGIRVIKALSKEEYEKNEFAKVNKNVVKEELKTGYTMARLNPIISLLLNVGLVAVLYFGARLVVKDEASVGTIIAFTSYFTIIANAMLSIRRIFEVLSRSSASAKRIEEVFAMPSELEQIECEDIKTDNYIEFKNVSFSYNGKVNNLNNICFSLKKGETLGIIGPTGSGKSTIINLLMRFYDINEGQITVDSKDIKAYSEKELKSKFGVCFQNDILFSDTVRNNVKFNRDITDEEVLHALRVAQAQKFIEERDGWLDSEISSKGTNISGGQKQRLLIARALAGSPEIIVLDDASSALDYQTDAALRKAIKEEYKDVTQIVIAQRISSVTHCDHILMLDDGYQVGYGTHEELLKTNKDYLTIYNLQMGDKNE